MTQIQHNEDDFERWEDELETELRLEAQCPTCELWYWADGEGGVIQHILEWHPDSETGRKIIDMIGGSYA